MRWRTLSIDLLVLIACLTHASVLAIPAGLVAQSSGSPEITVVSLLDSALIKKPLDPSENLRLQGVGGRVLVTEDLAMNEAREDVAVRVCFSVLGTDVVAVAVIPPTHALLEAPFPIVGESRDVHVVSRASLDAGQDAAYDVYKSEAAGPHWDNRVGAFRLFDTDRVVVQTRTQLIEVTPSHPELAVREDEEITHLAVSHDGRLVTVGFRAPDAMTGPSVREYSTASWTLERECRLGPNEDIGHLAYAASPPILAGSARTGGSANDPVWDLFVWPRHESGFVFSSLSVPHGTWRVSPAGTALISARVEYPRHGLISAYVLSPPTTWELVWRKALDSRAGQCDISDDASIVAVRTSGPDEPPRVQVFNSVTGKRLVCIPNHSSGGQGGLTLVDSTTLVDGARRFGDTFPLSINREKTVAIVSWAE